MRNALSSVSVQWAWTHVCKSPGSLCLLLALTRIKSLVICILPLVGFPGDTEGHPVFKICTGVVASLQLLYPLLPTHVQPAPWHTSPQRCTWVQPHSILFTMVAACFFCALRGIQCFKTQFLLMNLHLFVDKVFCLFLTYLGFTPFPLWLLRDSWGAAFAAWSLTLSWLVAGAGSRCPASRWFPGPRHLFKEPPPARSHPVKASPSPQTL